MTRAPSVDPIDHGGIAAANRRFYARTAAAYEATETCVVDRRKQDFLEQLLDDAIGRAGRPADRLSALDACGGSGNVSLKLLRRGLAVTNVDVSPDMHEIFRRKLVAENLRAEIVPGEIADFLSATPRAFDLVVFSSAVHHIKDVERVMRLVLKRLRPGGVLVTAFDPTPRGELGASARGLLWLDYVWFKLTRQTGDVLAALRRRLTRSISTRAGRSHEQSDAFDGVLAEYHVRHGIDDGRLAVFLESIGFDVVRHTRLAEARSGVFRSGLEVLGAATEFALIAQKRAVPREVPVPPHYGE